MSANIDAIIEGILDVEGEKFTNDPNDSGGPTKWGITLATLSQYLGRPATIVELQALTRDQAHVMYRQKYVEEPGYSLITGISTPIAAELVDTGVNCGTDVASTFLQRCLNAFNLNGTKYPTVVADGNCGPSTVAALRAFLAWRGSEGERVMLRALNCLKGARYITLEEKFSKDAEFVYGWIRARIA